MAGGVSERAAPYPADTRAKGWRFELDHERIRQSDTWALAPAEARPWLLMLWMVAWEQVPCGSLPADDELVAARIGAPAKFWQKHKGLLLRGWWAAEDGRLYHDTIVERVRAMLEKRAKDARRAAGHRAAKADPALVTQASRVTRAGVRPEFDTKHQAPSTRTEPSGNDSALRHTEKPARKRAASRVSVEALVAEGVDPEHAASWLTTRAAKRLPLTPVAWDETKAEAAKAGMTAAQAVARAAGEGWAGFKAKWLEEDVAPARKGPPAGDPEARHEEIARQLGAKSPKDIIDA